VSDNECKAIAAIVGPYVDERRRLTSRLSLPPPANRFSKIDVIRLYRRAARQLGHGQADQRFHLELLRLSKPADFEEGRQVMLAHSNRFLEARCGMSRTAVGRQLRRHDGTTLQRSLSGNGHRFVSRRTSETGDGAVIDACGISLEPLIALMKSMRPMIVAQDELDLALAVAKACIGRDRRRQRTALELLNEDQAGTGLALMAESKALTAEIRAAFAGARLGELEALGRQVAEIADGMEQLIDSERCLDDQDRTSEGCENGHLLPIQGPDSSEPVMAVGESPLDTQARTSDRQPVLQPAPLHWSPRSITACFPGLEMYVGGASAIEALSWRVVDTAASRLARDLGINAGCWQRALVEMGLEQRCAAIGLVAELLAAKRIKTTAGQYFGGMLKRACSGELHLDRSVWGFRRKSQSG